MSTQNISRTFTWIAVILFVVVALVVVFFAWYQGAQEDALDYGQVNVSDSE